jgi:two-component system, NtrC family, response regulator AtoC
MVAETGTKPGESPFRERWSVEGTKHVLIADDASDILDLLTDTFEDDGFNVTQANSGSEALAAFQKLKTELDVVLLDFQMPGLDGLALLKEIQDKHKDVNAPVIIMTAYGTGSLAIKAMQQGAYDYITKPFESLDDVKSKINRALEYKRLNSQVSELQNKLAQGEKIIGNSSAMQEVYKTIGRVANSDATVLINGETGTGKELIANMIHNTSRYARGPFVAVNCGALPENLLESELFGYEAGAFTGAQKMRKGRFEMADNGTIFLDEVGEMTLSTQRKLLRVLQERVVDRLGGTLPVKINVRVISATNRDLQKEVDEGRFRSDLYYRLNVVSLMMPPLRDRKEDIPLLVEHFLNKHRYAPNHAPARFSAGVLQVLEEYDWPGNVRELENIIQRAVVNSRGGVITVEDLAITGRPERELINSSFVSRLVKDRTKFSTATSAFEKALVLEALKQANNDEDEAAAILDIKVEDLRKRVKAATA